MITNEKHIEDSEMCSSKVSNSIKVSFVNKLKFNIIPYRDRRFYVGPLVQTTDKQLLHLLGKHRR